MASFNVSKPTSKAAIDAAIPSLGLFYLLKGMTVPADLLFKVTMKLIGVIFQPKSI